MNQTPSPINHHLPRARRFWWTLLVAVLLIAIVVAMVIFGAKGAKKEKPAAQPTPALTVQVATAATLSWPEILEASGPIAAWQEAIIGSEISGQRLVQVLVNVGDNVKKGDVLARFNTATLKTEQAELMATWQQADSDSKRAVSLSDSGALSDQAIQNYSNQATIAKARLDAKNLQLQYATVVAPENGTITSRTATVGAIGATGTELFRQIVNNRIEWRGQINSEQLGQVQIGQSVVLVLPDGSTAQAKVRQISPTVDQESRLATLYADITKGSHAHAGMYASGTVVMKERPAVVVPAVSVVIRDGRSYVFALADNDHSGKVIQKAVTTGRHQHNSVEIIKGLNEGTRVVTQGAGFLNDGDTVRVVSDTGETR